MSRFIRSRAFANIALVKYWGRVPEETGPATPSIALALKALVTETEIRPLTGNRDRISLNGRPADRLTRSRIIAYLDLWRRRGYLQGSFRIQTVNLFPTKSGLASSASGYAALARALSGLSECEIGQRELSRLARLGSGSAARSIPGGLSALPAGKNPSARLLAPADRVPWGMVLAIVQGSEKEVGSREGMAHCRQTSPYYRAWVAQARRDYRTVLEAIRSWDLKRVGVIMESNALAMHACMMASRPGLVYFSPQSLALLQAVRDWRKRGLKVYATIDAGSNVALLCEHRVMSRVAKLAADSGCAETIVQSMPGGPAFIIESK